MIREEKDLIVSWFNHIEQMATNRKTLNGVVMKPMHALNEIKVLAKNSAEFIEKFWNKKRSLGIMIQEEQWVSVEEGLPEHSQTVLALPDWGEILIGSYDAELNAFVNHNGGRLTTNITHWMPLPQPPKGE